MSRKTFCAVVSCVLFAASIGAQNVPRSSHVWVINEENHGYQDIVGNSRMPYFNQLIQQYGLATQFYSDQHGSISALMWFVAGATVTTNEATTSCQHDEDNVVRELLKSGYSWRAYEEDLPYPGYEGLKGGQGNNYYRRHDPLLDFTDVCPSTGQNMRVVPFTQMATDFADGKDVNYAWITPDMMNDGHNGPLEKADQWLQDHVPEILARPEFSSGGDGILFIVWDESDLYTDHACSHRVKDGCGGHTATLVIGPRVKPGYQSPVTYHNENVLATVCAAMGLSPCPGAAQNASPMADFFETGGSSGRESDSVVISTPGNGATVEGAVRLIAHASENQPVSQMQVWDNGVKLGRYPGGSVDQIYNLSPGRHTTWVTDHDAHFKLLHQSSVTYDLKALGGMQVVSPVRDETFDSTTVHVVAQANESVPVSQMQVWDNGVKLGYYSGSSVNAYFNLAPGSHTITVSDLDDHWNVIHWKSIGYSVK